MEFQRDVFPTPVGMNRPIRTRPGLPQSQYRFALRQDFKITLCPVTLLPSVAKRGRKNLAWYYPEVETMFNFLSVGDRNT